MLDPNLLAAAKLFVKAASLKSDMVAQTDNKPTIGGGALMGGALGGAAGAGLGAYRGSPANWSEAAKQLEQEALAERSLSKMHRAGFASNIAEKHPIVGRGIMGGLGGAAGATGGAALGALVNAVRRAYS